MRKCFYIYVIFRPWDGSPCYVGKGSGNRWVKLSPGDRRNSRPLLRIIAKAKRLGMDLPIIKVRENLSEADAFQIERAFIAALGRKAHGGPLVNLTDGGEGSTGLRFDKKGRQKVSERSIAMWSDPATRKRIIDAQNEVRSTPEYRAARSILSSKLASDPQRRRQQSRRVSERFSDPANREITSIATKNAMAREEVRLNVSAAQTARFQRVEERQLAAARATGRKASLETRAKMSASHKARYALQREGI